MGRSVNYLNNAEYVIYFKADWINMDDDNMLDDYISSENWDDFMCNLTSSICSKLKSYCECDKWDDREVKIFLENELCEIGISEYCGLYSLSVRAKDDEFYGYRDSYKECFGKHHAKQVRKTLEKALQDTGGQILNRVGTFSNGIGVFETAK